MVLLAAAICNKAGKVILSRQFVEMTRARIEGLLAAFPKLMTSGVQHTFVETESVRYVYQPMEKLFILLITTKASNILEDLETLRLFARLVPEYCRNLEESEISDQSFPLIFAFDEIVALGYRENVNLAQIRTFIEMDSHEEKVFMAVRQTQEKEAKENMKRKARELQQARREAAKRGGGKMTGMGGGGYGGSYKGSMESPIIDMTHAEPVKSSSSIPSSKLSSGSGRALKLGSKTKDVDVFVHQLKSEGEKVSSTAAQQSVAAKMAATTPQADQESVHVRVEEKLSLTVGRDGGIHNLEIHGMITLRVSEEKMGRVRILVNNNDDKGVQLHTHPNVDKKLFLSSSLIGLKNPDKPFPVGQDVGVLKWRLQSTQEDHVPLSINCWPSETGTGCDVNIEYELKKADMELNDIRISIPTPSGVGAPVINECDGQYQYDNRRNILEWSLPVIDSSNDTGSMEFSIAGHPEDFFPISVSFMSKTSYCDIQIVEIQNVDESLPLVKYSSEVVFFTDKYEIV